MGLLTLLRGARRPPAAPSRPVPGVSVRVLAVPGVDHPVEVRRTPRARRLTLKVDATADVVRVVAPPRVGDAEVGGFVLRHLDWLRARLAALPPSQPFCDGALVPIQGRAHRIRHIRDHRGPPRVVAGEDVPELWVGGEADFLNRRVGDHLRKLARRHLSELTAAKAAQAGLKASAVSVRDTTSRWGSCSSRGRISYSWRLILAPPTVLDYVVAHEVSHLREMNHSPRFWALCASLTPDIDGPKAWLKANGTALHRYG